LLEEDLLTLLRQVNVSFGEITTSVRSRNRQLDSDLRSGGRFWR
jgi:hypothetical protein